MSIKRFLLGGECDGDGGRCYADMVRDDREGDYVLYDDHIAEVKRLRNLLSAIRSDAQAAHWHEDIDAARGKS